MVQAMDGTDSFKFPGRLIQRLSGFSFRHPGWVLSLALLLASLSVSLAWWKLEFHTHRDEMISDKKWCQQNWKGYLKEFGQDDDLVVLALGGTEERKIAALGDIANQFHSQKEHFDRVFWKIDLQELRPRALFYLSSGEIEVIVGHLANMSPLLEFPFAWNLFSLKSLICEAHARIKQMETRQSPSPADMAFLNQFQGILRAARKTLEPGNDYSDPWAGLLPKSGLGMEQLDKPQYLFSKDKSLAVLLARPVQSNPGADPAMKESVALARKILQQARTSFPDIQFGLTGLPVLEADEMAASQSDSARASIVALAGVLLLYFLVFRSWRFPVLTIATLCLGTLLALGWLTLTIGHLNLLSATFAVMLIGLGDYGVLWVTSYAANLKKGMSAEEAMRFTARESGPGILTAAGTSSLAFFATMMADFKAVAEMGWIAGWGILFCALSCFTALPAMLAYCSLEKLAKRRHGVVDSNPETLPFPRPESHEMPWFHRYPKITVAAGALAFFVLAIPAWKTHYDHNLLSLQSPKLESVSWEKVLLTKMPSATWHAVTFTATRFEALEWKKKLELLPEVCQVTEIASLLPGDQDIKKSRLGEIQHRLRLLPSRGARPGHAPPDLAGIHHEITALQEKLKQGEPADQDWQNPIRVELAQLFTHFEKMGPTAAIRMKHFEESLTSDLIENLHQLKNAAHPLPIQVEDIPKEIRERYLSANGQWLLRVFARENLWEYSHLKQFVEKVQSVDTRATGKPFTTLEGLQGMRSGFQKAGLYALGAILIVLFWDFRKGSLVCLTLLPLALGAVSTLGILVLAGIHLNPANMIGFPILAGVGIDNAVHVVHDRLSFRSRGAYRLKGETFKGIFVAGLTTILGFGALTGSNHVGLASLGFLLGVGVTLCMTYSVIWLPAVLQLTSPKTKVSATTETPISQKAA